MHVKKTLSKDIFEARNKFRKFANFENVLKNRILEFGSYV